MLTTQIIDWLIRASVLLAVALLLARVLERRLNTATLAHRVLVGMLACILLLPLCGRVLPGWGLPSIPSSPTNSSATPVAAPVDDLVSAARGHASNRSDVANSAGTGTLSTPPVLGESVLETVEALPSATLASARASSASREDPGSPARSFTDWAWYAALAWMTIAGLLLVRVVVSFVRLQRFVRGCSEASPELARSIRMRAERVGIRGPVQVRLAPCGTMPLACWSGAWTVVVPEDLKAWPESLREATLWHELGHIARRDAWSDFLVQGMGSLLWPNPLAWLATWDIRRLRERACDEWSLAQSGLDARQYALSLLEVVGRCQASRWRTASAMADTRDFESRLRWLLAKSRPAAARPFVGALTMLLILGLAMCVATATPFRPSQAQAVSSSDGDEAASAPGVVVTREPAPDAFAVTVRGTVFDRDNRPLAGAAVVLRAELGGIQYASIGFPHARDILARTTSNAQGEFTFERIGIPRRLVDSIDALREGREGGFQVLAWAEDHALQWQPIRSFDNSDVDLRLPPEADVSGVVVDEDGVALEGAELTVTGFTKATDSLDGFLRDPGDLNLIRSELKFRARILDGRFSLKNMPEDYRILLRCRGPRGHRVAFLVDTGDGAGRQVAFRNGGRETWTVHRSPMRVTVEQQPWVRVQVVDHQGRPVTGGGLGAVDENRHYGGEAALGEDGTAVLIVNEPGVHKVFYSADPLSPGPELVQMVDIQRGGSPAVQLKIPEPRVARGKVVDRDTGEPIAGVYIFARRNDLDDKTPASPGTLSVSDAQGEFELPLVDGEYDLSIQHHVEGYFVRTNSRGEASDFPTVRVSADQVPQDLVVRIGRGVVIVGVVLDADGEPASGVNVLASSEGSPYRRGATTTDAQGRFRLEGFAPHVPTRITAWSDSGMAQQTLDANERHPWNVTLERSVELKLRAGTSVRGRVVHLGEPVADVQVGLWRGRSAPNGRGMRFELIGQTRTDAQGRYRLTGLAKNDSYYLQVESVGNLEVRDWHYQPPYSQTVSVEEGATIALPDAVLVSNDQTLSGVVVDPDGNPLGGLTVSARLASGGSLSRPEKGPPPWTETDAKGRFQLRYLPDEPISLLVYRANPAGGRIRESTEVRPARNARDIRIEFEPKR